MKHNKIIIILFILFAYLNLQSNFFIKQNLKPDVLKTYFSTRASTLMNQAQTDNSEYNVTLCIKDWEEEIAFKDLNVTLYELDKFVDSKFSDETGNVSLQLKDGHYIVSVQSGNRTVGYQEINVTMSDVFIIKTWAYNLNVTFVDEDMEPLMNHTVSLYDQMVFLTSNNYTVITDYVGWLVNQTETDENGTVHFMGLWNGTYRIKIFSGESSGDYVLDLQKPTSLILKCIKVDLVLKFISEYNVPIWDATICIYNEIGHLFFQDRTNETGFIEHKNVYVIDGLYAISARYGNRTIGYEVINVTKTETFTVKVWAYNLTVKCVDQEDKPLTDHFVFLHDQLIFHAPDNFTEIVNQTGLLVNWTKTDENGTAYFNVIWNGTYRIRVMGGELIGERTINLQKSESININCNKTYMMLNVVAWVGDPLPNATVYIYNSAGHLVFRDCTDQDGYILHEGVYLDKYTVFVEWMETEVWSGTLDIYQNRNATIRCSVYRFTALFVDPFGNPLPQADVTLRRKIPSGHGRYIFSTTKLETDETGRISCFLPSGSYEVSCSYGIYSGSTTINLVGDYLITVGCDVHYNIWLLTFFTALPFISLTLLLERRKLRKPLEVRRYRNMLLKLESMYKGGLVEYKIYRKLKDEYEANLMKLGGREMK